MSETAHVQTSELSGISGEIADDRAALIHQLRASLAGAEKERDAARAALAGPLTYHSFSCARDHAVECAYLMSLAEAEYARDPLSNPGEIIELYARGDVSMAEAIEALQ